MRLREKGNVDQYMLEFKMKQPLSSDLAAQMDLSPNEVLYMAGETDAMYQRTQPSWQPHDPSSVKVISESKTGFNQGSTITQESDLEQYDSVIW